MEPGCGADALNNKTNKPMQNIRSIIGSATAAAALALNGVATASPPSHAAPITLAFEKCLVDPSIGLFTGTVGGEWGPGSVVYETIRFDASKAVWELEGWHTIITSDCSFTAQCSGIANTHNGVIVLNGEVTTESADFAGAQVQVRAILIIGQNSLCSEGRITLTPTK